MMPELIVVGLVLVCCLAFAAMVCDGLPAWVPVGMLAAVIVALYLGWLRDER